MRIVHVSDCYLPRLGGIESHVADLVARQRCAGHDVHVVTSTPPAARSPRRAASGRADSDSARVHRIRAGWVRGTILGSAGTARSVDQLEPDVVHCHNSVLSPLAVMVATTASALGIPTAVTVHSLLPAVGPILPLSGSVLAVRGRPIAWSAVSEVAAEPVRRVLGARTEVTVLPNAVDIDWWRDARSALHPTDADTVKVVSVGRLATRKRPLALLRMMATVRDLLPSDVRLRLVLVGDGPQRASVARRIREQGMAGWVDLAGQLSRQEIRDTLAAADIYVAPATLESFGIAALEARSVGLPIVAKARGGVGQFVTHGTEGLLARTDGDMVGALARLATSPALRRAIRSHNCAVAPAFGWDDALSATDELYARAAHLVGQPVSDGRRATLADLEGAR
jgi:glycosyltransferase involved in cell wall biosynthesis